MSCKEDDQGADLRLLPTRHYRLIYRLICGKWHTLIEYPIPYHHIMPKESSFRNTIANQGPLCNHNLASFRKTNINIKRNQSRIREEFRICIKISLVNGGRAQTYKTKGLGEKIAQKRPYRLIPPLRNVLVARVSQKMTPKKDKIEK